MVNKCYLLGKDETFDFAIDWLLNHIPCSIKVEKITRFRVKLYIKYRPEDAKVVYRTLQRFM